MTSQNLIMNKLNSKAKKLSLLIKLIDDLKDDPEETDEANKMLID
jgi:hypothetical protein